jgi:hypothetical protein
MIEKYREAELLAQRTALAARLLRQQPHKPTTTTTTTAQHNKG